jgi:ribosome-associated translation inhibitor RaiA
MASPLLHLACIMPIEIKGIQDDRSLRARISRQMNAALKLLGVAPVSAEAAFFDDNGPKGGTASRCALTVQVPYRPAIRVEHVAETARLAFDGAFPVLERRLERYVERDRDLRRRPKKYYAAKRLMSATGARKTRRRPG